MIGTENGVDVKTTESLIEEHGDRMDSLFMSFDNVSDCQTIVSAISTYAQELKFLSIQLPKDVDLTTLGGLLLKNLRFLKLELRSKIDTIKFDLLIERFPKLRSLVIKSAIETTLDMTPWIEYAYKFHKRSITIEIVNVKPSTTELAPNLRLMITTNFTGSAKAGIWSLFPKRVLFVVSLTHI